MKLTAARKEHYVDLFKAAKIRPAFRSRVDKYVKVIKPNVQRYRDEAAHLASIRHPVPDWVLMTTQALEASGDLTKNFHNGQSLSMRTTIVPKGRGPFKAPRAWEKSVEDSLLVCEKDLVRILPDWSLPSCIYFEECYNGTGYYARNLESPYLWSGTQFYTKGKYVRDGVFDKNAISDQCGVVTILLGLIEAGIVANPLAAPPKLALLSTEPEVTDVEHAEILFALADRPTRALPDFAIA